MTDDEENKGSGYSYLLKLKLPFVGSVKLRMLHNIFNQMNLILYLIIQTIFGK